MDISARKQNEDALRRANETLEARVRERTRELERAQRLARFGSWSWTVEGDRVEWTEELYRMHGLDPAGPPPSYSEHSQLFVPESWARLQAAVSATLAGADGYDLELEFLRRDGSRGVMRGYGEAERSADGTVRKLRGTAQDVTEQRTAERLLEEQRNLLELVLEHTVAGYWDWRPAEGRGYLSPAFKRMFGYEDHEIENVREAWRSLLHPDDLTSQQRIYDEHVATRGAVPFANEARYRHKDGSTVWILARGRVIEWSADGRPTRMVGCHIDITARKESEERLQKLSDRLALATRAGRVGIWDWDLVRDALIWDDAMFELYGRSRVDFPLTPAAWREALHPDDRARAGEETRRACEDGADYSTEFRAFLPDGSVRHIKAQALVQCDAAGQPVRMIGTNWDVTARRQIEEELRATTARLEASNRELSTFSYSVSHDLRAPLRGIDGWSLALLEDCAAQLDDRGRRYLGLVRSEAQRMGELIDGLLRLSRVTQSELRYTETDLSARAEEAAERLRQRDPQRVVAITIAPNLVVSGDADLLDVVLQNLLENAWKFTSRTTRARIEVGAESNTPDPTIFVRDNGAGFDPSFVSRLFAPFHRLHGAVDFPGNGIGLATVQRIIQRHGGRVWAESKPDAGATFYFSLPAPAPPSKGSSVPLTADQAQPG